MNRGIQSRKNERKNYQTVIESLTEKFQILNQVQSDLKEIKDNLFNKN
ncbi:MAG: BhlA/UviB family holin-like peptide [Blautia wexlerae]